MSMNAKVSATLEDVPLRNLKASLQGSEGPRQNMTPEGALVEHAMKCARLEPKQLADAMGISTSFLLRGFKDCEHISWQRLRRAGALFPLFKRELLWAQAEDTKGVRVRTVIEEEEEIA